MPHASPAANSDDSDPNGSPNNKDTGMNEPAIEQPDTDPSQETMTTEEAPNENNEAMSTATESESIDEFMEVESSSQGTSEERQSQDTMIANASDDAAAAAAAKEQINEPTNVVSESAAETIKMEVDNENKREGSNNTNSETPVECAAETNDLVDRKRQKRLGEAFHLALEKLQERISASVLALRTDDHEQAQNTLTEDKRRQSNSVYASLADSAKETYHALLAYGSQLDLSSSSDGTPSSSGSSSPERQLKLSETQRARLVSKGKNIWMTIRGNPELFDDTLSENVGEKSNGNDEGDYLAFEAKKYQAVAGGYVRSVVAQLVFLDYIDTRCSVGNPPRLNIASVGADEKQPSVKELVFGLKVFSRAGKAILAHSKNDPRACYFTLSLAASCFHRVNEMATTNGEAAEEVNGLLDEAFDAFSLLPNAVSQLAKYNDGDNAVEDWPAKVIKHLKQAKKLLDGFCNLSSDDGRLTSAKIAILQSYLPSLARLCYKHGSQLTKIDQFDHASNALHIALEATNACLEEVRAALKKENDPLNGDVNRKAKGLQLQVLHNLEADLVVVSIESFYVLSHIFQSSGKEDKALQCLDMIERYMKEQKNRDDELYATAMSKVDKDFVFSESNITTTALGPKKQDKQDIKARASTVRANAKKRHAQEKATLAFCRLMVYHKIQPRPSPDDELLIDKLIWELVDLFKSGMTSHSNASSPRHALNVVGYDNKSAVRDDHIFALTLDAIRVVNVRRILAGSFNSSENEASNLYNLLLESLSKSDSRRPFILLDRLTALLTARFQMEGGESSCHSLDKQTLLLAREYIAIVKSSFEQSSRVAEQDASTLFVDSSQAIRDELIQDSKAHFARAVSLYHSSNAYDLCAEYAEMLETVLGADQHTDDFEKTNAQLGEVIAIKAYSLSMIGKTAEAYKSSRDAWAKVTNIDTFVNLFNCSLNHEVKHSTCDTLLELDTAINDLSLSNILAAFPRLSNSCVDNGAGIAGMVLLGLQERWVKMLVCSKMLHQVLQEKSGERSDDILHSLGGHSVFDCLRAYLANFEHVVTVQKDLGDEKILKHCLALLQVITTVLGFIVTNIRDVKLVEINRSRRKRKEGEPEFVLIWDDDTVKELVGNRADCVWVAEQTWNLSNKLMMMTLGTTRNDTRKYSSELFAAAHDFCLLSEEEEGATLSKDFLDIDIQQDSKMLTPVFKEKCQERPQCDISSEFSSQCLLLSAATAVDFVMSCNSPKQYMKELLRRSLHRLSQAKDEFALNSEDDTQKRDVEKMVSLLTMRCLLGIGDDSLAHDVLVAGGLDPALVALYNDESSSVAVNHRKGVLQNAYLVACAAEEKKMSSFGATLQRSLSSHMSGIGKFVLKIDDSFSLTLAEIQRKVIQSASTTQALIEVYKDIDVLVKKRKDQNVDAVATSFSVEEFYSTDDLDWLAIEAYNQGVSLTLLGDHQNAGMLFASALNITSMCSKEVQGHSKSMHNALSNSLSKHSHMSAIFNQVRL